MKKVLYVLMCFVLSACVTEPTQEEIEQAKIAKQQQMQEVVDEIDNELVEGADPFDVVRMYEFAFETDKYNGMFVPDYARSSHRPLRDDHYGTLDISDYPEKFQDKLKPFAYENAISGYIGCSRFEPHTINKRGYYEDDIGYKLAEKMIKQDVLNDELLFKCYGSTDYQRHYSNQEDDCILYRRNHPFPKLCGFNYSKYLPNIKTAEEFIDVHSIVDAAYRAQWECDYALEVTSSEKEQCKTRIKKIVYDYVKGKKVLCRNAYPKVWNKVSLKFKDNEEVKNCLDEAKQNLPKHVKTTMYGFYSNILAGCGIVSVQRDLNNIMWNYGCIIDMKDLK